MKSLLNFGWLMFCDFCKAIKNLFLLLLFSFILVGVVNAITYGIGWIISKIGWYHGNDLIFAGVGTIFIMFTILSIIVVGYTFVTWVASYFKKTWKEATNKNHLS